MPDLKDLADKRAALLYFDPLRLQIKPGLNGRDMASAETEAQIEWLATSIAEKGVIEPLEIFREGDAVFVSHGHCRLAAAKLAISRGVDVKLVPCVQEPRGTSAASRLLNQIIVNAGNPLSPIEIGRNIMRCIALGKSKADIAQEIGRSLSYVVNALDFQAASPDVHNLVRQGDVSATLAASTIRKEGPTKGADTIKKAVASAKAKGKKKATKKDLPPDARKQTALKQMKAALVTARSFIAAASASSEWTNAEIREFEAEQRAILETIDAALAR
jgi:ParB family chromosome partitioning protein